MKKQKNGYYRKQVYIGKKDTGKLDVEGNPIKRDAYKAVTGKTIQEVEEKVYHLKIQLGKGIDILASQDPFEKWAKMYLDEKKTEGLSNTYIGTLEQAMKHLAPIMQMPISKVEIQHLKAIINSLAPGIEPDPDRTVLSKRTLTGINQFAKRVFNLAIEYRAIDFNPANFVRIPKNAPQSSRSALTEEQQRWIVEYEHRAKRAAMIMLFAGLRRGEVGALTWGDIHLDEGYISVTKSVEFIKCQPWVKEPKTKAGIRTVDIPQILVDYLRTERGKDDCMYVLHTQYGHMLSETTWCQIWKSYMKDLNVTYGYTHNRKILMGLDPNKEVHKITPGGLPMVIDTFTPHQLRHTFATNCYFAEVPVEVCRDWMGHSNIKTTLEIYTHLSKRFKREKRTKLDEYFADKVGFG